MLKFRSYRQSIVSLSLLLASAPALATPLGSADMFNAYATGSINYGSVDIEGVVGSAGNITFLGGDVGRHNNTSEYSMYSGGNVSLTKHHVYNGGIEAAGDVNVQKIGMSVYGSGFSDNDTHKIRSGANFEGHDGTVGDIYASGSITTDSSINTGTTNPGSSFAPSVNHAQISTDIQNASSAYAAADVNGSIDNVYGKLVFNGGSELNVFDISAQALSDSHTWEFSGLGTFVLNILGTNLTLETFSGFSFTNGASREMLLYNFIQAIDLNIRGRLDGSILAPLATTNLDGSGVLNGSIYTKALIGKGQINSVSFNGTGTTSSVPNPATLTLMLIGFAGLFSRYRKKQR